MPAGNRAARLTWSIVCGLIALMFLFPLLMVVLASVKTPADAAATPPSYLPHHLSFANYRALNSLGSGVGQYLANSVSVAFGTVLGTVILSTLGGYGFSRFRFPGRDVLFFVVLITMMVPFQVILTPLYLVLFHLHLANSLIGLALVYITFQLPFSLFLVRNSFAQVPQALFEAAFLDGCSALGALWSLLPLVTPGVLTAGLFAFFSSWNEFLAALIFLSDQAKFTLPVMLTTLVTGQYGTVNWGVLDAGVVITMLPCILIFLLLQRYYVRGLTYGAVK